MKNSVSDPKLTLSALLGPEEDFRVKVGISSPIISLDTPWVNNAKVYLWENGVLIDTLQSEGRGSYYSPVFVTRGSVFSIEVNAEGYQTITATDTVPSKYVHIKNLKKQEKDYMDSYGDLHSTYFITFTDIEGANFYEFFDIEIKVKEEITYTGFHFSEEYTDPLIKSEGSNEVYNLSLIFNDQLFSENSYTLKFIPTVSIGSKAENLFNLSSGRYMVLRNTSSIYYQFRKSLAAHLYNQQKKIDFEDYTSFLFDSKPEPLFSNVINGYGIFAFYTQDEYKLAKIY